MNETTKQRDDREREQRELIERRSALAAIGVQTDSTGKILIDLAWLANATQKPN